jgi:hypothetical protein
MVISYAEVFIVITELVTWVRDDRERSFKVFIS